MCTSKLKLKRDNALSLANSALPDDIHFSVSDIKINLKNHFKRGFNPLGEAISWVSGLPSQVLGKEIEMALFTSKFNYLVTICTM